MSVRIVFDKTVFNLIFAFDPLQAARPMREYKAASLAEDSRQCTVITDPAVEGLTCSEITAVKTQLLLFRSLSGMADLTQLASSSCNNVSNS